MIRLKHLNGSYSCNFSASVQQIICDTIPVVKNDSWINELHKSDIILSDIGGENQPIIVLIGADVAGKLLTGKKVNLENRLTAIETFLGWTVIGKLPAKNNETDTDSMVVSMHARVASLSDLWNLDVLGILEPIKKLEKSIKDDKTREFKH